MVRNGEEVCRPGLAYMGFISKIGVTTIPGGPPAQNPGSKSPGYLYRTRLMDLVKSYLKIPRGDFHISIQKPLKSQMKLLSTSGYKNFVKIFTSLTLDKKYITCI